MPKQKTHKGAAKRFSITKSGLIKHGPSNKRHNLTSKTTKRKRQLRGNGYVFAGEAGTIKKLIPYK